MFVFIQDKGLKLREFGKLVAVDVNAIFGCPGCDQFSFHLTPFIRTQVVQRINPVGKCVNPNDAFLFFLAI